MRKLIALTLSIFLISISYAGSIIEGNEWKIKRAASILSTEIIKRAEPITISDEPCNRCHRAEVRAIKVSFDGFTDLRGRKTKDTEAFSDEFRKQLICSEHSIVFRSDSDLRIEGVLIPFKGREKWRFTIRLLRDDSPVASYEGIIISK
jgi:hypothetical protein